MLFIGFFLVFMVILLVRDVMLCMMLVMVWLF